MRASRLLIGLMSIGVSVTALAIDESGASTSSAIGFGVFGLLLLLFARRKPAPSNQPQK